MEGITTHGGAEMTVTKLDMDAALARLVEAFPQTFVLEKYQPHWPLKVGIAADIPARCPDLEWRVLSVVLSAYALRVMYLQSVVAGAARVDLDGKESGKVTARDAEYAAATLAKILASRQAGAAAAKGRKRVVRPPAPVPSPALLAATSPAPSKVSTLRQRPVLRLPAIRPH
jgi:ProP effector